MDTEIFVEILREVQKIKFDNIIITPTTKDKSDTPITL